MSRVSRGCLPCRTRRVKCDEGRPACHRCVQRSEICNGYRDESSLIFRYENEKVERKAVRRRASSQNFQRSDPSSYASEVLWLSRTTSDVDNISQLSTGEISVLKLCTPYHRANTIHDTLSPPIEDQVVSQFFEKYVMYPCNSCSSPGFLEHLPSLFGEVNTEGRVALRWAVHAVAYASLSSDQSSVVLGNKALDFYGLTLSALLKSLISSPEAPDDYTLMTVVILDIFESVYLQDTVPAGSHVEGMAQILRLRGPNQIYGARGWSLFRLSHHRLQKQQLAFKQGTLPESEAWLDSLNEDLPSVRTEKDKFQINKICERARNLFKRIEDTDLSVDETLDMIKEMHALDQVATTWRGGQEWAFQTIPRSQISLDKTLLLQFPKFVQLHRDVWIAYEWNYHRTARIVLHQHLLACLDRLQKLCPRFRETPVEAICSFKEASIAIIQALVDDILSTVPQSLGDIDHEGHLLEISPGARRCTAIGGYFLLWPIKVAKRTRFATAQQINMAQDVFERIRECTGMKSSLGEKSII